MSGQDETRFVHEISIEEYDALRQAVGWAPVAPRLARISLDNTLFLVAAVRAGCPVGMARVVGDGGYIAYIADVIVLPECQRSGIGTALMEQVMRSIRGNLLPGERVFVNLMAAAGIEPFYNRFGVIEYPSGVLGASMSIYMEGT